MITFITALYPEAKSLITAFHLKQNPSEHHYRLFEGDGLCLCVTESGMISAAACVARHFSLYPPKDSDIVINLGISGYTSGTEQPMQQKAPLGHLFLVNKITEQMTGRTFYPDLLYKNDFTHLALTTVARPANDPEAFTEETLIDMEASALYQALLSFFTTERMFFFKVVSDVLTPACSTAYVTPEQTETLIAPHIKDILTFAENLARHLSSSSSPGLTAEEEELTRALYEKLPVTESTHKEITRLLRYVKLTGAALTPILTEFLSCFPDTPVRGKKQAAPYLQRLRELVLAHAPLTCRETDDTLLNPYVPFFHNNYIEENILKTEPSDIPSGCLHKDIVPIAHYKDIFNRSHQNFAEQKKAPALIYAKKSGTLIYEGAPVCQSFGNEHFYYTSCMMNCIYHCDYCYLQGMYPSGHTVAFFNLSDYFAEVEQLLKLHPVYLCISYDTDLLAMEQRFGFVRQWLEFAKLHQDLTLEIRTKSGNATIFKDLARLYESTENPPSGMTANSAATQAKSRIIFAWTVSPETVAATTEHGAPSPQLRLLALKAAKQAGFSVRLCFDPMIYHTGWRESYAKLVKSAFNIISPADLYDVSIGVFRISTEYLKVMRKKRPDSAIVQFPYVTKHGVSHYGALSEKMIHYLRELLLAYLPEEKIFVWDGGTE